MERVKGIEPSSQAWEAHILPLNHTRVSEDGRVPTRLDRVSQPSNKTAGLAALLPPPGRPKAVTLEGRIIGRGGRPAAAKNGRRWVNRERSRPWKSPLPRLALLSTRFRHPTWIDLPKRSCGRRSY